MSMRAGEKPVTGTFPLNHLDFTSVHSQRFQISRISVCLFPPPRCYVKNKTSAESLSLMIYLLKGTINLRKSKFHFREPQDTAPAGFGSLFSYLTTKAVKTNKKQLVATRGQKSKLSGVKVIFTHFLSKLGHILEFLNI